MSLGMIRKVLGCAFIVSASTAQLAYAEAPTHKPAIADTCVACHGQSGVAANPIWPNLAAQKQIYLAMQLHAYCSGERENSVMASIAKTLTDENIDELSRYYASLQRIPTVQSAEVNELGKNVRARCMSCHGRNGETVNGEWPNLAGQNAAYLRDQLLKYQSGIRKNGVMQVIAAELSADEITAVAEYYSQQ